jgi:hypothetical protein
LKKHAQIITIQQLNTNALYDESQRHKKILIAMSILIIALGIKTIFF